MRYLLTLFTALALVLSLSLIAGCGGGEEEGESEASTGTATEEAVAVHDCDGGCGMTDVPMDQLTEIDGKYYCAGCTKKVQAEEKTDDPHAGHDHD